MERKSKSKFKRKGFSPFTSNELTDEDKFELWRKDNREQDMILEEEDGVGDERLKIHKPEEGAY